MSKDKPPNVVATYEGLEILNAPHLTQPVIESIKIEKYERGEVETGLAEVRRDDRIVEMGAGAGIVGGIIAKRCRPSKMVSFEANPSLVPHIHALLSHNDVQDVVEVRNQIVLSQAETAPSQKFYVMPLFLGSAIEIVKGHKHAVPVDVPVARWDDVKAEVRPTVLVMDIEGAEREFFRDADLSGIRTIMVEVHRKVYGRPGMREMRGNLSKRGFEQDFAASRSTALVFRNDAWQSDQA